MSLYFTEFARIGRQDSAGMVPLQCAATPPLASGSITLSGSNQQSSAFNADTWLLRVTATVNAWIAIAANPDATTTPRIYMPAGTTEYFVVSPSHKIAGVTA